MEVFPKSVLNNPWRRAQLCSQRSCGEMFPDLIVNQPDGLLENVMPRLFG